MRSLPALKISITSGTGIILGYWVNAPALYLISILTVLILLAVFLDSSKYSSLMLYAALVISGFTLYETDQLPEFSGSPIVTAEGTVKNAPRSYRKLTYLNLTDVSFIDRDMTKTNIPYNLRCRIYNLKTPPIPGARVQLQGKLHPFSTMRNPGEFDSRRYYSSQDFLGKITIYDNGQIAMISQETGIRFKMNEYLKGKISELFPDHYPTVQALLLGFRDDLDKEFVERLRNTGLSHLLALSGLHVGFLILILLTLGGVLNLPYKTRSIFAIVVIIIFLWLVPHRASTIRAGTMAILFLSGNLFYRWSPPLNTLGLAALLILIWKPGQLFDIGFQLSFAAMFAIFLFSPIVLNLQRRLTAQSSQHFRKLIIYGLTPLLMSTAIVALISPFTAYHFKSIPVLAPVFNLFAIPLMGLVYAAAWMSILISFVIPALGNLLADGTSFLILSWQYLTSIASQMSPVLHYKPAPVALGSIIVSLVWLSLAGKRFLPGLCIVVLIISGVSLWDANRSRPEDLQVWFLDVGKGDSCVILFPEGITAVIDGGKPVAEGSTCTTVNLLRYFNRSQIDLLVATHPEADHIGGLIRLIEEFPIGTAICSPIGNETNTYAQLIKRSKISGLNWQAVSGGDRIQNLPPGYEIIILNPPVGAESWSLNDMSIVLQLTDHHSQKLRSTLLLTGDIERKAEKLLVNQYDLDAELLKVPHHGSQSSSTISFIDDVDPTYAIISNGDVYYKQVRNIVKRYRKEGVKVFETREEGAIAFQSTANQRLNGWKRIDWRDPQLIDWLWGIVN